MDWQDYFERLSELDPRGRSLQGNVSTNFWELLYQAFKARMIEEMEQDRLDIMLEDRGKK